MTRAMGYVQAVERAKRLAVPGSLAEAVWLAALRAGCGGAFPVRDAKEPLAASAELVAVLAVMERLPRVVVAGAEVRAHG